MACSCKSTVPGRSSRLLPASCLGFCQCPLIPFERSYATLRTSVLIANRNVRFCSTSSVRFCSGGWKALAGLARRELPAAGCYAAAGLGFVNSLPVVSYRANSRGPWRITRPPSGCCSTFTFAPALTRDNSRPGAAASPATGPPPAAGGGPRRDARVTAPAAGSGDHTSRRSGGGSDETGRNPRQTGILGDVSA